MFARFQALFRLKHAERHGNEWVGRPASDGALAGNSLQQTEESFARWIADIQDYAIFMLDPEGKVATWNAGAERIKGYSAGEIIGQHFSRFYPRDVVESGWPDHELREAAAQGRFEDEGWRVRKDASQFWASVVITAVRDRRGTLLGFAKITRDLTERKIAEENARRALQEAAASRAMESAAAEIERQRQQLDEDRLYLASIVESSDDAIISQTLEGKIASWNRGAERLYGYTQEEALGKSLSLLIPPELPDEVPGIIESVKAGESIEHYETQRMRKDGSRVHVSLTISPVRNARGVIIGASKIARDITARVEEDRRKNEFIALLAHELRNPLAPLRNALEVLHLAGNDPQTFSQTRTMMERQLRHLVRLVDDLLDVGRITQGKLQLRKERISLQTAISNALEVCEALARDEGRQLTVDLPEEEILLDADQTRLAQAICNLLSNAVKYSGPGSRIWLSARREGHEAVISVRDEGIGISRHMLQQVFDLFMQVDRSLESSQGGLGVGLAIVKRLVEMHGGNVEARSEGPGRGSEFIIRVPAARHSGDSSREPEHVNNLMPAVGHRVLVCDDNADSAQSLALLLKLLGNEIRVASDGEEGLRQAAAFHPELVFLDIGMPGLNGYDLCRRLREEDWGRKATIVALTGWGQEEDRKRSLDAGFDRHFVKPVEPVEIERLIAAIPALHL